MKAFESYHPVVLMLYFVAVLAIAMFCWHPVLLALSLAGGALFYSTLVPARVFLREAVFLALLAVAVTALNPFFSHGGATPLFFVNGNAVTLEAIRYGLALSVMLAGVVLWFRAYGMVMNTDKFLYLFGRLLPALSLVLSMAMRFIPLFRRQMKKVGDTQRAMGLYREESLPDRARFGMRIFSTMVTWALEHAVETADSMKARGYGLPGRSHFSLITFSGRDAGVLVITACLAGIFAAGAMAGGAAFSYYPRTAQLSFGAPSLTVYAAFGALCFLPAFIEIKEKTKWTYFKSKI